MAFSRAVRAENYTVGWICALPIEMAAATAMLDDRHEPLPRPSHDHNIYTFGRVGSHNVVLACLPAGVPGTTSAAVVATRMLSTFTAIKFSLMVGVGGGVPNPVSDIRLGDVVISKPSGTSGGVIQYDFGKTVQEGRFVQTGLLNKPPSVLLHAVASLETKRILEGVGLRVHLAEMPLKFPHLRTAASYPGAEHDRLFEAWYDHQSDDRTCASCDTGRLVTRPARNGIEPTIHYGLIASGNQVMRHGVTRERLRGELDVLCFEMEAAGLMDDSPCLVIRGICDYADSHKNKEWQPYAAAAAAACAKELLLTIPATEVVETKTFRGVEEG
jgi:nucleoside phosphorylase